MTRNVRTYGHVCPLARALETLGDRWTLLVVRDLLSGPKRFTDLMARLGGITPKTLTQRLRELADTGLVEADHQAGRRETWYRLTPAGLELSPAVEALSGWGLKHAWRPPRPGEQVHVEHLLRAATQLANGTGKGHEPALWHLRFTDDTDYAVQSDGHKWTVTTTPPSRTPDLTVTATTGAWIQFVSDPTTDRARELDITLSGPPGSIRRLTRLLRTFRDAAN